MVWYEMLEKGQAGFTKLISAICLKELQALVAISENIQAAFVATAHGYELASVISSKISSEKLASITVSMHGLGEAVVSEAMLKYCTNVTIEAENGKVVMLAIADTRDELLLSILADAHVPLGQILWSGRQCAERISVKLAHRV